MRILLCSSYWPPKVLGGAELYAAELAQRLTARGHEVGVVTLDAPGEGVVASLRSWPYDLATWRSQPAWRRAVFHAVDASYNPVIGAGLRRVLRRWAPDVVHSHSVPGFPGAVLSLPARLGLAHVHTLHDYWLVCQRSSLVACSGENCATRCSGCRVTSGLRRAQARLAFPQVVIAISAAVAREHRSFPQATARMRVIRHARPEVPRLPRPARRRPAVFGYLGQLVAHKGVTTLLAALTQLPPGAAELVVAGKGPLAGEVASSPVSGVRLAGWVSGEEKEAFFASIDCLVVPSQWPEPSGAGSGRGARARHPRDRRAGGRDTRGGAGGLARTARERHRQVAALRALGCPPSLVRTAFLAESGVAAAQGLGLGAGLALLTCSALVTRADVFGDLDVALALPWGELAVVLLGALAASLLVALPAARRAARTAPVPALRAG